MWIVDISPELSEKQEAAVCISGNEELWLQNILLWINTPSSLLNLYSRESQLHNIIFTFCADSDPMPFGWKYCQALWIMNTQDNLFQIHFKIHSSFPGLISFESQDLTLFSWNCSFELTRLDSRYGLPLAMTHGSWQHIYSIFSQATREERGRLVCQSVRCSPLLLPLASLTSPDWYPSLHHAFTPTVKLIWLWLQASSDLRSLILPWGNKLNFFSSDSVPAPQKINHGDPCLVVFMSLMISVATQK